MWTTMQHVLKKAISIFIILCSLSTTYGQTDLRLFAVLGSFSVYPVHGNVPTSFSMYHTVTVDSNSIIIIEKAQANVRSRTYYTIGPKAIFSIAKISELKETVSNDSLFWYNLIKTIRIGELPASAIQTTLPRKTIRKMLFKIGFEVSLTYPDKKYLNFELDPATYKGNHTPAMKAAEGNPQFITMDDTLAVTIENPSELGTGKYEFIQGKWEIFVRGTTSYLIINYTGNQLKGRFLHGSKEIELESLNFNEPLIWFNLTDWRLLNQQDIVRFIGQVSHSKPYKIHGIFKQNNHIYTWFAKRL